MTRALVVGYGSIGQRHARLLTELGCEVSVVSRRELAGISRFASVEAAVAQFVPDYVVVANETFAHAPTVEHLRASGFKGKLLIEKPLGGHVDAEQFAICAVGYNLRFHPALAALSDALIGAPIVSMQIYCGQYLPEWRPQSDYRMSYSADPARGGGVLRDLSHELDYLLWLGGGLRRIAAIGGRFGNLGIASDDCWALLLELERCRCATLQINYLDRPGRRQIVVNAQEHTYAVDLMRGTFVCDGSEQTLAPQRDDTYLAQHRAMLADDAARLCSVAEAARVMQLIAAAEGAAERRSWIAA